MAPEPTVPVAPRPRAPRLRGQRVVLVAAALLLLAGAAALGVASPPDAAEASVTPSRGFRATVLGWSSWYGSYAMGSMGSAWCIDHGLRAPDPSFRYVPTAAPDLDPGTGAAISWIVTAHGGADALDAAAVMLVLHDLRRASYPFGVIDVDRLTTRDLAGFGGHEAEVLARARALKAEARAHGALRAPFHLALTLTPGGEPAAVGGPAGTSARDVDGRVTARLTDAGGRPVVGAGVALAAQGAELDGATGGATDADGSFAARYRMGAAVPGQRAQFEAHAIVPDPVPATFASSTVRAQRVVRGAWLGLEARATPAPAVTTTTSSRPNSTSSTTSTSTTSTSTTSSTTTSSTTTSTSSPMRSTIPPSSTTSSTSSSTTPPPPATSSSTTASLPQPAPGPPTTAIESLPRTGSRTAGWALIGGGLVLLGATLVAASGRWAR